MTPRAKRNLIDFLISLAVSNGLAYAGAGLWALVVIPYGLWNFYDGLTRRNLRSQP